MRAGGEAGGTQMPEPGAGQEGEGMLQEGGAAAARKVAWLDREWVLN